MHMLQSLIVFFGRVCLSLIFIISGFHKILDWQGTERGFLAVLCNWHTFVHSSIDMQHFFASLMDYAPIILSVVTALELLGGFMVLLGIKPRLGAFFLLLFFIPITIIFHHFWFLDGLRREMQITLFLKNISIIGGLLLVIAYGKKEKRNKIVYNVPVEKSEMEEE